MRRLQGWGQTEPRASAGMQRPEDRHRLLSESSSNLISNSGPGAELKELDAWLKGALNDKITISEPLSAKIMHDQLYRRFMEKYGTLPEVEDAQASSNADLVAERRQLLAAISQGDVSAIRSFIRSKFSWDFLYPPATTTHSTSGEVRLHEGWCRSPLSLLVRPEQGCLKRMLPGVPDVERHRLIADVLRSGVADPNYPKIYWCTPAMQAALEGDVSALRILQAAGCDLKQRVEFRLQGRPLFTLAHAAAYAGHLEVMEFLEKHLPVSFFSELDANGSNPLHVLLESSGSSEHLKVAQFLMQKGVDGFVLNKDQRSPLSMAIEKMPKLAKELLAQKSSHHGSWWGTALYWFSFDGVVLPLHEDGAGPLHVCDGDGKETTIEELILATGRKELCDTPLILDLLELKWQCFGFALYRRRLALYTSFILSLFFTSAWPVKSHLFKFALVVLALTWCTEFVDITKRVMRAICQSKQLSRWVWLDFLTLVLACIIVWVKLHAALTTSDEAARSKFVQMFAPIVGILQVVLVLRWLCLLALLRSIGPMLISLLAMIDDFFRFAGILIAILLGFVHGYYAMVHFGVPSDVLEGYESASDFSYAYHGILYWLLLGLIEPSPQFSEQLPSDSPVRIGAGFLFWSYVSVAYFMMLNLLIAVFNTTYTSVFENAYSEWNFLRLRTMLDFEFDYSRPGVQLYYKQLMRFNNRRTVHDFLTS